MKSKNLKQEISESKKRFILLQFTRELIKHSEKGEIFELENILKEQSEEKEKKAVPLGMAQNMELWDKEKTHTEIAERIKIHDEKLIRSPEPGLFKPSQRIQNIRKENLPVLRIPRLKLPPRFQYLRPTPANVKIDLGKLNPLIKDPSVRIIESNGANQEVIVEGKMGRRKTKIILDRKEIDEIINKFSKVAKIPTYKGVFKVVIGKLIFSAIISEVISSKFIIKKMIYSSEFR